MTQAQPQVAILHRRGQCPPHQADLAAEQYGSVRRPHARACQRKCQVRTGFVSLKRCLVPAAASASARLVSVPGTAFGPYPRSDTSFS